MRRFGLAMLVVLGVAGSARAESRVGGVFAERPLPDGAVSVYGLLGFPTVNVGVRQGFGPLEIGGQAGFDYTLTQLNLDVPFRLRIEEGRKHVLAVGLSVGGFLNFGANYFEETNRSSAGLRLAALGDLTLRITEGFAATINLAIPADICLTERGDDRYQFRAGGGGELDLGDGYSVGAQVLIGPDLLHPRGGQTDLRFGISVLAGLGKRFF